MVPNKMELNRLIGEAYQAEIEQARSTSTQSHDLAFTIAASEETKPLIFVRLHGPQPSGKRIVQLSSWYPGEWLLPRLRHPVHALLGLFALPRKAWSLFLALTGGTVRGVALTARNEACSVCPAREVWITKQKAKEYCGACGCARWWLSELRNKNHLRKWACPLRRWDEEKAGPYPDAALRARLLESGYVSEDDLCHKPGSGCGGCGGANNGRSVHPENGLG